MKKLVSVILTIAMTFTLLGMFTARADEDFTLTMQINNPIMTVNGADQEIDKGNGTTPVIVNERTLVPIRAIIEAMGGTVGWEAETKTATLNYGKDKIDLVIDSKTAYLNGNASELDTAPAIINERTMLPIRFIAENFKFDVKWDGDTQTITITKSDKTDEPDAVSSATAVAEEPTATPEPDVTPSEGGTLIAYFSRAGENYNVGTVERGNTALIADYISENIDCDVFEIIPEVPYPTDYTKTTEIATEEKNSNARPAFKGEIENFEKYDTVYIGYPIWWGSMPMIMYTFLETYDMTGKTVIPFSTNEGSGWGSSKSELNTLCSGADIKPGLSMRGSQARETSAKDKVTEWLDGLGE